MSHWKYSVACVGIKKHARKTQRHFFSDIGQSSSFDENIGRDLACSTLAQKMKTFSSPKLHASFHEETIPGILTWAPFNEAHNKCVDL